MKNPINTQIDIQLMVIGLGFVTVPLLAAWFLIGVPFQKWHRTGDWAETPATIIEAKWVEPINIRHAPMCSARYRYIYNGQVYENDQISLYAGADNAGSFHRIVYRELKEYEMNQTTFRCYVNPENPAQSILYRHIRWGMTFFVGTICLLFTSIGVWIIFNHLKQVMFLQKKTP